MVLSIDEVNGGTSSTLPDEVIAEGTSLVEAFLSDWASRTASIPSGDIDMTREGEGELGELKEVYEEWKERLEASQWVREVLSKTA